MELTPQAMQTAFQFLDAHPEVAFATCEGGLPRIRTFQVMKRQDNVLYFATSPRKDVYRQLLQQPDVELLALADQVSVRCKGQVHFRVPDDVRRWIFDHNPVLPRLYRQYDELAYFALPVAELDYYDLRPTPPILRHFDLLTGQTGSGFVGERYASQPKDGAAAQQG